MVGEEIRSGKILLAEPYMADPNFSRAAVLLCDHGAEGSVGFILNKELEMPVEDLIDDFPEFVGNAYYGGPVKTDTIHYLHSKGDLLDGSVLVSEGVYWGGNFEKLKFLISAQLILPEDIRFFVGYSGWGEGQLTEELSYGSWLVADMDANYLLKNEPAKLWQQILTNKGDTYTVIAQMPDEISWN